MARNKHQNKHQTPRQKPPVVPGPGMGQFMANILAVVIILIGIIGLFSLFQDKEAEIAEVPVSELAREVLAGDVAKITVLNEKLEIELTDGTLQFSKKEVESALSETLARYGVGPEALGAVEIGLKNPSGVSYWLLNSLPFLLPILFILMFFWFISRQVRGAGMQAFTFGQSKARIIEPGDKKQRVTFKDVAGAKEAKEELMEIVDFLKNPKKFLDIGARIPKGVLLMGAPGTGKTLLARAVAGEAGVPFFSISGSEFVEMFVGVGASRVRDLFKLAKKTAPAIIFIDEIDAVGRSRGVGMGGGNDEREQTLNQILVEMDGFEPAEKVIVVSATNRPDVLDPALLRPGRFDRRVIIDEPDVHDREEILKIHANKKPLAEDVDLRVIAERTPGFSGADLQSLMNEGAILAARENRKKVLQKDLVSSIEKVMLGPERKSHLLSKKEKEITAYHEAGHALVASILPHADPVHKVSIVARGRAGGYTLKLPFEERKLQSKKAFLDDLAVSLGGYAAEQFIFGDLTTGPSNDLQVSTALARDMVTKYGMSEKMGPVALEEPGGRPIFGREFGSKDYSERVSAEIDAEVSSMMRDALKRATDILVNYRGVLDAIAATLTTHETIEHAEFEALLREHNIMPKQREAKPDVV